MVLEPIKRYAPGLLGASRHPMAVPVGDRAQPAGGLVGDDVDAILGWPDCVIEYAETNPMWLMQVLDRAQSHGYVGDFAIVAMKRKLSSLILAVKPCA